MVCRNGIPKILRVHTSTILMKLQTYKLTGTQSRINYFLVATDDNWSRIRPNPSNSVARVDGCISIDTEIVLISPSVDGVSLSSN